MDKMDEFCVKHCWGNLAFEYNHSEAIGFSGGILCVWDPNSFCKINSTLSDYFVINRGYWRLTGKKLMIVAVYAPQEGKEKQNLWDFLQSEIAKWNGDVIIMGDFNEIRSWNKTNMGIRRNAKIQFKKKLEAVDTVIDNGMGNDEVFEDCEVPSLSLVVRTEFNFVRLKAIGRYAIDSSWDNIRWSVLESSFQLEVENVVAFTFLNLIRSEIFNGHESSNKKANLGSMEEGFLALKKHGGLVGHKLSISCLTESFRWIPRDGNRKKLNVDNLKAFAAIARMVIDSQSLPKGDIETRWIRYVPNKVNILAWKVMTNSLPTRFNISRRGIYIESLSCVNCDTGVETLNHLFFSCDMAKRVSQLIARWWDVPHIDIDSYGNWRSWIDNIKMPKSNKSMLEGVFYVTWWLL
ncbi:RNA-directed DNA polymerase, eukaryota [Tanacetum coccineum]